MDFINSVAINIYSIIILIFGCIHCSKQQKRSLSQDKLYVRILQITIFMLVADTFSRFDNNPSAIYHFINHFNTFLIFLVNPILPSLWLVYIHDQVFQERRKTRRLLYLLFAINGANIVMVVLTQFWGWYYYIDSSNLYHRGPLFLPSALTAAALMFVVFVLIISSRKKIERRYYFQYIFVSVPPFLCVILQIVFYGVSIMLNSVVLSLLIVFFNIQNENSNIDYLTGVYNRKKLDIYLKEKVRTSTYDKSFSAIMIDLNNFKSINDTFGHSVGDNALRISARLLRSCIKSRDFIARFGGDEFCIVLDVSDSILLEEIVCRINRYADKFNKSSNQPYEIRFSMGYALYDYFSGITVEEFQKQIDTLMYKNKNANKDMEISCEKGLARID